MEWHDAPELTTMRSTGVSKFFGQSHAADGEPFDAFGARLQIILEDRTASASGTGSIPSRSRLSRRSDPPFDHRLVPEMNRISVTTRSEGGLKLELALNPLSRFR